MKLAELQSAFQHYLQEEQPKLNTHPALRAAMVDDATVGIRKRLNIYHHAYRVRMQEALGTVYPNLSKWLGCQQFNQVVLDFIADQPSTYRNLRWMGDTLDEYLRTHYPEQALSADLAAFEWSLSLAFDAEDLSALSLQDLGEIPPDQWNDLRFNWHPSVRLNTAQTQVVAAWQALEADETPEAALQQTHYMVWRQEMMSYFKTLDAREYSAIKLMMTGHSFGELCEALTLTESDEQAVNLAATYLSEWLNAGMLYQIK